MAKVSRALDSRRNAVATVRRMTESQFIWLLKVGAAIVGAKKLYDEGRRHGWIPRLG